MKAYAARIALALHLCIGICSGGESADARGILVRHYEALGGLERVRAQERIFAEGTVQLDGLRGTFRHWSFRPQRYRTEEHYGVLDETYGDNGLTAWRRDTNGRVHRHRDAVTLARREVTRRLDLYEHIDPGTTNFFLGYGGTEYVGSNCCHVIIITNAINSDVVRSYVDAESFMPVRTVAEQPDFTYDTRYSDFRAVDGVLHAFRTETAISPIGREQVLVITNKTVPSAIDAALFDPPPENRVDFRFLEGRSAEDVPVLVLDGNLFIHVTVSGDEQLWLLDSGASMSLIDADYADSLGIPSEGRLQGFGLASVFDLSFVRLPGFRVRGLEFDGQRIYSYRGLSERYFEPSIRGILGYDFLSRVVTKVDYAAATVSFYDPETFAYSGAGCVVDAPLEKTLFVVPVTLEGRYAGRWSVDVGAASVSFNYPYAESHGLLDRQGCDYLVADLASVYTERKSRFRRVTLGGYTVDSLIVNIPLQRGRGSHAGGDLAGNLGNALLRHFVLYLDYRYQRIILEPGADFNKAFPCDRSGCMVGPDDDDRPVVVHVVPGSPAETSGLRIGDRVLSVDGRPAEALEGTTAIARLFRRPAGTVCRLRVNRGGVVHDIKLVLRDLYE